MHSHVKRSDSKTLDIYIENTSRFEEIQTIKVSKYLDTSLHEVRRDGATRAHVAFEKTGAKNECAKRASRMLGER